MAKLTAGYAGLLSSALILVACSATATYTVTPFETDDPTFTSEANADTALGFAALGDEPGSEQESLAADGDGDGAGPAPATEVGGVDEPAVEQAAPTIVPDEPQESLKVTDLQVLGSHNSYHLRPVPAVLGAITALSSELGESIDYSHRSITEQLDFFGIRQFEFDVFADPAGGLYANRAALPLIGLPGESGLAELDQPGFKVLHTQDFDFESNCLTLQICLNEIARWSDANPDHVPVLIMIEMKDQSVPEEAIDQGIELPDLGIEWTVPVDTTAEILQALDAELIAGVGQDRIITPDVVRGDAATLEEAVLTNGWPALADARGKVMFAMVNTDEIRELYREPSAMLAGRVMFTSSDPGQPDAAFLRMDNPARDAERIAELAAQGYLIRTRTDSPTEDARTGDTTRRDAALASGAHYLSTDYYTQDPTFGTGYQVRLREWCNPVTAPDCDLPASD